ncbi:MAG: hypothetical protein JWQ01_4572 [Massilia sp.]|nr:hypothetical protein [Massilia sp.]
MNRPENPASHVLACSLKTLEDAKGALTEPNAEGALARGKVFELVGNFEAAIESYSHALLMDEELHLARARLALAQLKNGDFETGLVSAMKLAACQPKFLLQTLATDESVGAMSILGDALVLNGRLEDAEAAYEAARNHNRSDTYATGRLAQLYLTINQPQKSVELRPQFSSDQRFHELTSVLRLAETSNALLPSYSPEQFIAKLTRAVPGRPLITGDHVRQAELMKRDDGWCADLH